MTQPLTIAIVQAVFAEDSTGGRVFEEEVLLAALMVPSPHRLVIYPSRKSTRKLVDELGIGHRVSFINALRPARLPKRIFGRATRTVLRRKRPLPYAELNAALRKAGADCAWMLGGMLVPVDIPYVATIHDLQHRLQPWFPEVSSEGEWRTRESFNAEFVQRAASVIVGTTVGAREVREAYGDAGNRINVVPMPTPSFAINAGMRPRGSRPEDLPPHYLLYPAQFWPHKNHVTAIRTLSALGNTSGSPDLILVGSDRGNRKHVMELAQKLGVAHRVRDLGFVDQKRLVSLYQHADALLFPSLFGPDNLPPLEAMALGCPVIAARVSGAEEQLGDCAILVDGLDADGFADAVRLVRNEPMRVDAMLERARARARGWTTEQYASAVLSIFSSRIAPVRALWR